MALVDVLAAHAARRGCTPGQLALAWLLATSPDAVPIPGTNRRSHLEENVAAAAVTLGTDELAALAAAIPRGAVAGARYGTDELTRVGL